MTATDPTDAPRPDDTGGEKTAAKLLVLCSFAFAPVTAAAAWMAGNAIMLYAGAAIAFALMGALGLRVAGLHGRLYVALGLVGQSICLTAALAGHPWQIDSHMTFFALLAMLMALGEPLVIISAAAVIAVHHLSLSIFLPQLVYPSTDIMANITRTAFHGVVVVMEAAVLFLALHHRKKVNADRAAAHVQVAASAQEAQAALEDAQTSKARAETALQDAKVAQAEALEARSAAEAQAAKAVEADSNARALEQQEAARREASQADQKQVVSALREGLNHLSAGDLSKPIETEFPAEYEDLRRDFNMTVQTLDAAMSIVAQRAGTIIEDVFSIEEAAQSLAKRTEEQASTLEQTTATISQIAAHSDTATQSAREASASVTAATSRGTASEQIVSKTVGAMSTIEESSAEISKIVQLIEHIAFQTNLLALNAGVEAARAGEAGRGFSVVASEVRALALRSSEAARNISDLIEESAARVEGGVKLVHETGEALAGIVAAVQDVAAHVTAIESASTEQTIRITESSEALRQLEGVTQKNAAMFEQTTSVTQSMGRQGKQLQEAMSKFATAASAPAEESSAEDSLAAAAKPAAVRPAASAPGARKPASANPVPQVVGNTALAVAPDADTLSDEWEQF